MICSLGYLIEKAGAHQPQRVNSRLLAERPGRSQQPVVSFVDLRVLRQRIARVQIERHVELFLNRPERPVLFLIVIGDRVGVAHLRESVGERADHAEILDAALQLLGREIWILQRQGGEGAEAIGLLAHGSAR